MAGTTKYMVAQDVLNNINKCLEELEHIDKSTFESDRFHVSIKSWATLEKNYSFQTDAVCEELSIFDWWTDTLAKGKLLDMKKFVEQAIKLGYTGYVCFKVGASGCANGMWAYKNESTTGYSPKGEVLYRSFTPDYTTWDAQLADGTWLHEIIDEKENFTLKEVKNMLKGVQA